MNHENFILESFKYFCQISSKSIFIISSYTVSKLVFLRHSVDNLNQRGQQPLGYWYFASQNNFSVSSSQLVE